MKLAVHIFEATGTHIPATDSTEYGGYPHSLSGSLATVSEQIVEHPQLRPASSAIRIVGVLAFCQSLIFLVIWLVVCVTAGAATKPQAGFTPELKSSSYDPVKARDPFEKPGYTTQSAKLAPGVPIAFQLQGILYQSTNPSAIVNGKLVTLDKNVTLTTGNAEVQVRAVEITRDHVVLEAGGQRVELWLNAQAPRPPSKE